MPDWRESELEARQILRTIADDWRVTSYSGLQQHGQSIAQDLMPKLDIDAAGAGSVPVEPALTPHQFHAARHREPFCIACLKSWILPSLSLTNGS